MPHHKNDYSFFSPSPFSASSHLLTLFGASRPGQLTVLPQAAASETLSCWLLWVSGTMGEVGGMERRDPFMVQMGKPRHKDVQLGTLDRTATSWPGLKPKASLLALDQHWAWLGMKKDDSDRGSSGYIPNNPVDQVHRCCHAHKEPETPCRGPWLGCHRAWFVPRAGLCWEIHVAPSPELGREFSGSKGADTEMQGWRVFLRLAGSFMAKHTGLPEERGIGRRSYFRGKISRWN